MLRILRHPNIVEFHAAFTFDGRPTLLFGEAGCDLKQWLQGYRSVRFSELETLEALYGLSSALHQLHQYFLEGHQTSMIGCHFDLHPGNILIRNKTFILSDFGLSRLKYETQGSQSYFKGGVRDYCAPECQDWEDFEKNKSGRPSDIWSLGCIITEVATFLRHGAEGLQRFGEIWRVPGAMPVLKTFHDTGCPHQGITAWIEDLSREVAGSIDVAGLANIVHLMLAIGPLARPDAHAVSVQLYHLCLNIRYCKTLECFKSVLRVVDYGWRIEYERLKIWARQLCLGRSLPDKRIIGWLLRSKSAIHFKSIFRDLSQLEEHCDAQRQYSLEKPSAQQGSLPLHVLRLSIDALWQTQHAKTIGKINKTLEDIIISVDDAHVSRVARFVPEWSRPQLLLAIRQAMKATNENMQVKESLQVNLAMINGHQEWQRRFFGKTRGLNWQTDFVLTELLHYDNSWLGRYKDLITCMNALIALLSKLHLENELPLLRCRSFCRCPDRQAYGMMYEIPQAIVAGDSMPQPLTLLELIRKTTARPKRPALENIFKLAHTLASSTLAFHKAGWLHKSISAYNIIFFPRSPDSAGNSLPTVRIIGFNYSRESDEGVVTVGLRDDKHVREYQHPAYRVASGKVRYREAFGYYSLGLVLLELGRWKTLRDIAKDKERQVLSPYDLRSFLMQEEVSQLKSCMGTYYHDAVAACLVEENTSQNITIDRKVLNDFDQKVVQPLAKCLALYSG